MTPASRPPVHGWAAAMPALALLAGCASVPERPIEPTAGAAGACLGLFERVDREVEAAGVGDAGAARIEGFPWLRVDRPLASFRDEVGTAGRFAAWLHRLGRLDAEARRHETANLPAPARERLAGHWRGAARAHDLPSAVPAGLEACRQRLNDQRLARPEQRDALRAAATVPDAYSAWRRLLGLYPFAKLIARPQIRDLHEEMAALFAADHPEDAARDYAVVPGPKDAGAVDTAALVRSLERDALGVPAPGPETRAALFTAFAPVWSVETAGDADRPGAVVLDGDARPVVDPGRAVEYRRLTWTRFDELVLPQVEYTLWFPARAPRGRFDIYAGHLDAVTWRVTLGPDGEVLAQDSSHACGCYYTLLPGPGWRVRDNLPSGQERVFAPATAPQPGADERLRIGLEADRHYVTAADSVPAARAARAEPLAPLPLDRLRSLPRPDGGHASAYDPDGFITESNRPERFLLWPLGVPKAGTMRQPGHQAIAFIGRRHFDDPRLLERLLERAE